MPSEHSGLECASQKRPYQSPCLVVYGALRDLTQAGSGKTSENEPANGAQCSQTTKSLWTLPPCAPSDRAAKENIVRVGEHPLGIGLYLFNYKPEFSDAWGHGRQFGVVAQEVETIMPEAVVTHPDGYKMVKYEMLGITRFGH